jgi:hypothetical protein
MPKSILSQLDSLTAEVEDLSAVMEKTETYRTFSKWIQERHAGSNIVCEINKYREILSIDREGTLIKADSLLQIRYTDDNRKRKKGSL